MERAGNALSSLADRLRSRLNWEIGFYMLLVLVALGMRLWDLGARAIAYDECIHVCCSLHIFDKPLSWCLDAWTHGPFQFEGTNFVFVLFGESDFTARLLPVVFGTAIVALPYLLRHQLGRWGGLAVATLLAFSPMFLYFSRYARNDIYIAFFMLLLVVCLWRYIEERKARYLYIGTAALSLSFCTKEVTYITLAILAFFLLVISGRELAIRVRRGVNLKNLSAPAEYLILIGTLSLPLFAAFIQLIPGVELGSDLSDVWAIVTVVCMFAISAAIGLRWNWRRWLVFALIFYGIFTLIYTVFLTSTSGFAVGLWGNVDYWIEQQGVARGGQPWYYYIMLMPIYEFLPLLFAAIGAVYYAIKGNTFSRFLVYWAVLSLMLYSFFGEKMPWLSLHIALPAVLLGGMFVGRLVQAFEWRWAKPRIAQVSIVLGLLLLFSFTVHVACQESYQKGDEPPQMLVYAGISSDVPRIAAQIGELAQETGEGKELAITVDGAIYDSGWRWYLRDYENVDFSIDQPIGSVLIVRADHEPAAGESYLENYGEGERIKLLLWFPEEYKSGFGLGWWWRYFLHRETLGPYWTTEGIVYFPKGAP